MNGQLFVKLLNLDVTVATVVANFLKNNNFYIFYLFFKMPKLAVPNCLIYPPTPKIIRQQEMFSLLIFACKNIHHSLQTGY